MPGMKPHRVLYSKGNLFLGMVTSSREKRLLASSCLCIRPSVQVYQMGSQLTDFREVRDYYENPSELSIVNFGHFTWDLRTFHAAGDLKSPQKRSLPVKWYHAVRRAKVASTLRERATMSPHCLSCYVNLETTHPQLCFALFPSFHPGFLQQVRLPFSPVNIHTIQILNLMQRREIKYQRFKPPECNTVSTGELNDVSKRSKRTWKCVAE